MGSIAAGGRYDRLVGMFSASGQQTPCVGVSIGIERVLTLMEEKVKAQRAGQRVAGDVEVGPCSPSCLARWLPLDWAGTPPRLTP